MKNEIHKNPALEIFNLLSKLFYIWHGQETQISRHFGISVGELECLRLFYWNPQWGVKELLKQSQLSGSRMSRILDQLEDNELINRSIDRKDRRNTYVTLTDKGKTMLDELQNHVNQFYQPILEELPLGINSSTILSLRKLLEVMEQHMEYQLDNATVMKDFTPMIID